MIIEENCQSRVNNVHGRYVSDSFSFNEKNRHSGERTWKAKTNLLIWIKERADGKKPPSYKNQVLINPNLLQSAGLQNSKMLTYSYVGISFQLMKFN